MLDPLIFIGKPFSFKGICNIYPPTVEEVVSNAYYSSFVRLLTITQEDIEDEIRKDKEKNQEMILTPLEFLLNCSYNDIQFRTLSHLAFEFFLHEKVEFVYEEKKILIGEQDNIRVITEDMYFDFQNAIRLSMGQKPTEPPEPFNPNENPKIREMKRKARERDRAKAKQASKNGIQLTTCLVAICCMGIGITPLNIGELSYAAIGPIMDMMQEKEKYDIDIRSLLAGADSKKIKPKYWIRNSDKE